jgi:hypothetical protein
MPNPYLQQPLSQAEAQATIAAVETAVETGAVWPLAKGGVGRSALVEASRVLGIAASTMRNRLRQAHRLYELAPLGLTLPEPGPRPDGAATAGKAKREAWAEEQRRVIGLEDEVARLRRQVKALHRADLDADSVKILLGRLARAEVDPPAWTMAAQSDGHGLPEVPVTVWADWHMGEVVSSSETNGRNAYDPEIAEARVRRLVEATVSLAREHGPGRYPGIVVNLLGDFVSGGLHPELAKTDAEEPLPTVLRCVELLSWALGEMLAAFGAVYVPCASGNHGRATQKPEFKRYVWKNFDWLIYQLLARHFANEPRITFDIPDTNEVHYRVFGQRYLAMHGDMLGVKGGDGIIGSLGPIARGETKVGKQASALGLDYDVLVIGHWHQMLWLPRVIVSGTLKGWDEYAKNALRAPPAPPCQPLWFVHPRRGITSRWEIQVEEPRAGQGEEWVSVRRAAA